MRVFSALELYEVAGLADVEALGLTDAVRAAGAFVDVPAEEMRGLHARYPLTQDAAARVFAAAERPHLIERGAVRREMDDQVERAQIFKRGQRFGDFFFGVFARRVEWRGVAVAESRPVRAAERAHLPMKINEAVTLAQRAGLVVRLVVAGQEPEPPAERPECRSAAVEVVPERGKITRGDIDVGGLMQQPLEGPRVAVDVAEEENLHGRPLAQPCSTTRPAASNSTRNVNGCGRVGRPKNRRSLISTTARPSRSRKWYTGKRANHKYFCTRGSCRATSR